MRFNFQFLVLLLFLMYELFLSKLSIYLFFCYDKHGDGDVGYELFLVLLFLVLRLERLWIFQAWNCEIGHLEFLITCVGCILVCLLIIIMSFDYIFVSNWHSIPHTNAMFCFIYFKETQLVQVWHQLQTELQLLQFQQKQSKVDSRHIFL